MRKFVIVVDAQTDFMRANGALAVAGAETLIGPMNAWLAALAPDETAGVLFTFDTHVADAYAGSAEAKQFPIHCVRGTPGWATVLDTAAIDPAIPLYRLEKGVFDMWAEADVRIEGLRDPAGAPAPRDRFFAALRDSGVEEVAVVGVAADFCVRWAIAGLIARGFRVVVPVALTRGIVRQMPAVVAEEFRGRAVLLLDAGQTSGLPIETATL